MSDKAPVLILFFTREEPLKKVFESVKNHKPSKLYLFQDGPRKNRPDDLDKILRCRQIVSNIDWECEVHTHFCEDNMGCDPAEYAAVKWALETEKYVIRLEDDNVASESFFKMCDELLPMYENDKRVFMICGRNQLGQTEYPTGSYFFSRVDSIWGFATWRDRWDLLDPKHGFLNDSYIVESLFKSTNNKYELNRLINRCKRNREDSIKNNNCASYESAVYAAMLLNSMLAIVPQKNLIQSAGVSDGSVHTPGSMEYILREDRWIYDTSAFELEFPLVHPKNVINNIDFFDLRNRKLHINSGFSFWWHKFRVALNRRIVDFKKKMK